MSGTFTCPRCGMTSHNPNDVREGYCGNCHDWTELGRVTPGAALRKAMAARPEFVAEVLREMGYTVTPPTTGAEGVDLALPYLLATDPQALLPKDEESGGVLPDEGQ